MEGSAPSAGGLLFQAVTFVVMTASFWKIFVKAGLPGWKSLIPIYNAYLLLKIVGKPGWWTILLLIPGVNIVVAFLALFALSRVFGKGAGFAVGLCLCIFVFVPILGFGSAEYIDPQGPGFKLRS